ncbi:hypothetical protein CMI37_29190 [Candidatus Pacearchaeota archaeon]|jgi:hypothetical protein|nr:hypothetical protein [Candidatus Pacearchaeota archaeon]|tara:strand:- start:9328 stop:9579 length:252 start_codon:yes stop_codon:yes gene_type:complete
MTDKKLSEEVLAQIGARKKAVQTMNQIAQNEFRNYLNQQIQSIGLDLGKKYDIDEKTGIVTEHKEEVTITPVKEGNENEIRSQ